MFAHFHAGTMTRISPHLDVEQTTGYVSINPADARALDISEGDALVLSSRRGDMKAPAKITPSVSPGNLFLLILFGENPTNVVTDAEAFDPLAKIPEFKVAAVRGREINGMTQKKYRYLFGPVPSRRFGRSLGIDLTPHKTCCFDCVFCQLGRTNTKTIARDEYVPTDAVLSELDRWLRSGGEADYMTLSGAGEPTLHSRFGEVLDFIRSRGTIPSVLLTNGALLHLPEVHAAASHADIVKISLSAWDQASFEWVNRPHPQLFFNRMIKGQRTFRAQFDGQVWMEVFLVRGMNSSPEEVKKIAALAREIAPDRIQLNTAVRPPTEEFVTALPNEQMAALTHLFQPTAEIIADFSTPRSKPMQTNAAAILAMLKRRPCTAQQIAEGFGLHFNEVSKYLGKLMKEKKTRAERRKDVVYYHATTKGIDKSADDY